MERCKNGLFGSTQATVLALKAIVAYDVKTSAPKGSGAVVLEAGGVEVDRVLFSPKSTGALAFDGSKVCCSVQ